MKSLLSSLLGIFLIIGSISAYSISITPPSNCIQYTDECGNMCIKKRDNSRSCNKKISCTTYQRYMCVAIVNDVDLDENKNKIIKEKYIPQAFGTLYTPSQIINNNSLTGMSIIINPTTLVPELYSPDIKKNTTSTNSTGGSTDTLQSCNNEDKPVCGMIPLICEHAPCFPVIQTYKNQCTAKAEGALYIQRGICTVKNNIRK